MNICEFCGKIFKSKENLNYHIRNKVCENKKFACKYCGNKFASRISMYRHGRLYCKFKPEDENEISDDNDSINEDIDIDTNELINSNNPEDINEDTNEICKSNNDDDNTAEIDKKEILDCLLMQNKQ